MKQSSAYKFAFDAGLGGVLGSLPALIFFTEYLVFILLMMFSWTLFSIFFLPWFYVCYVKDDWRMPPWVPKGPFW